MRATRDPFEPAAALVLQHGPKGPPARVGEWLQGREIPFVVHRMWEAPPPDPRRFAFVVSLGSQESAGALNPSWIPAELDALRIAVAADVPVLGLCFGGQALSLALGGCSDPLDVPEIGWLSVDSRDADVPSGPWLHYHCEQMRVPPGGLELARSPAGPAAFRLGPHLGVQFHPEVDAGIVKQWAGADPKLPALGVTPEELVAESAIHAPAAREQAFNLFDGWLAAAGLLTPVSRGTSRAPR